MSSFEAVVTSRGAPSLTKISGKDAPTLTATVGTSFPSFVARRHGFSRSFVPIRARCDGYGDLDLRDVDDRTTVAGAAAPAIVVGFGCSFVRVWLGDGFGLADPIVTIGGRPDDESKLRPATAARDCEWPSFARTNVARQRPGSCERGFRICIPIRAAGVPFEKPAT